ncbi:hypothetical protein BDV96DRAFT_598255 [Lophiotrema nucula]|uniref:Uncharacterized protein n=1 Tax=Lophiotrema nucula TaxID=690887 RepID=A0A6A5ZD22_9PLEO|nr:hypothetical protein BDV96DRAFT_598255 [Lophiotrema nucula]
MASSNAQNAEQMTTKDKKTARKNLEKERSAKRRAEAQRKSIEDKKTAPDVKKFAKKVPTTEEVVATTITPADEYVEKLSTSSAVEQDTTTQSSETENNDSISASASTSTTPSEADRGKTFMEKIESHGSNLEALTSEAVKESTSSGLNVSIRPLMEPMVNGSKDEYKVAEPDQFSQNDSSPKSGITQNIASPIRSAAEKKIKVAAISKLTDGGRKMTTKEMKAARKKFDKGSGRTREKFYKVPGVPKTIASQMERAIPDKTCVSPEEPWKQLDLVVNQQLQHAENTTTHAHKASQEEVATAATVEEEVTAVSNNSDATLLNEKIRELEAIFPELGKKSNLPFTTHRRHSFSCSNPNAAQEIIDTMRNQKGTLQMGANLIPAFLEDVTVPVSPFLYHETDMPSRWEGMLTSESGDIDHHYDGPLQAFQRVGDFSVIEQQEGCFVARQKSAAVGFADLEVDYDTRCIIANNARLKNELQKLQKTFPAEVKDDRGVVVLHDPAIVSYKPPSPQAMAVDPEIHDPAVITCKSPPKQSRHLFAGDKAVLNDPATTSAKSSSLGVEKTSTETRTPPPAPDFERFFHILLGSHQSLFLNGPDHTLLDIQYQQTMIQEPVYWGMVPHIHLPSTYMCGEFGWGYYVLPKDFQIPSPPSHGWYGHLDGPTWVHGSMLATSVY